MPFIAPLLAGVGGFAAGEAAHSGSSILSPVQRSAAYAGNRLWPNVIPSPGELIEAHIKGLVGPLTLAANLEAHGIPFNPDLYRGDTGASRVSRGIAQLWQRMLPGMFNYPSPGDTLQLLNRGRITEDDARTYLQRQGYGSGTVATELLSLREQLPGPSDLTMFALKEGWDPQVVQRFGYDAEFPAEFAAWMGKLGFNGDARTDAQKATNAALVTWAQMYWRVHWANLAPGQAYEMFQRLRPGRIARFQAIFPGIRPFTADDVATVLKVNDYPQPFRAQLAAIAYRVPRLLDIEKQYELRLIDRAELVEQHLDIGYDPVTAQARATYVVAKDRQKRSRAARGNARALVMESYRVGTIDRASAARYLYSLLVAGLPEEAAFLALPPAGQAAAALAAPGISAALDDADAATSLALAKKAVAAIHGKYLKGLIGPLEARQHLTDAGIVGTRITELIQGWELEMSGPRKLLTTAKIQKYYRYGILPVWRAMQYLANLGWSNEDASYILGETQRDISLDLAKLAEKTAKDELGRRKAIEQQVKALEAQRKKAVQALLFQATAARLSRYYVRGLVSAAVLAAELQRRGYDPATIAAMMKDAEIDRLAWVAKQRKAAEPPAQSGA